MLSSLRSILSKGGNFDDEDYADFASYLVSLARAARNSFGHLPNSQLFLGTLIDDAVTSAMLHNFPNEFRRSYSTDSNQCDIVHISEGNEYPISFKHSASAAGIGRTQIWFCLRWGTNPLPAEYNAECPVLVLLSTPVPINHQQEQDLECGFYYSSKEELNRQLGLRCFLTNNRTISGYSYQHLREQFIDKDNYYLPLGSSHMNSSISRLDYGLTLE